MKTTLFDHAAYFTFFTMSICSQVYVYRVDIPAFVKYAAASFLVGAIYFVGVSAGRLWKNSRND